MNNSLENFGKNLEREKAFITEAVENLIGNDISFYVFMMWEPTTAKLVQIADGTYYISCDLIWAGYLPDYIRDNHKGWTVEQNDDDEGNIVYVVTNKTNKKNYDIN